ncbi:MAG: NADPH-dependent glutamate synthase [Salinivirgaceae bacterium]|nr:NADPH-dependent glutamate synthase [Salinivirgaceae bacterium]
MNRFEILEKEELAKDVYSMEIYAPIIASAAKPGQFVILINDEQGERIPLTIYDYDTEYGKISLVIQAVGVSTRKIVSREVGETFADIVGPLGNPSELINEEGIQNKSILFIAGGIGAAPVYPQVKYLQKIGLKTETIIGARNAELIILEEKFKATGSKVHICTDDGSIGFKGNVTEMLAHLINEENKKFDQVVTIGPMIMMKFVEIATRKFALPCIVSLNTLMIDGTGMCGACRVTVGGDTKFACVDGPEFDAHLVDFDEAMIRQKNKNIHFINHICNLDKAVDEINDHELPKDKKTRVPVREQDPKIRATNFEEVCLGYNEEEAVAEASRCIQCKKPRCVGSCPVAINIPAFIHEIREKNFKKSYEILSQSTNLPAVCGRVCPQETQCEGVCVLGIKGEAVAIGKLERFVADWALKNIKETVNIPIEKDYKVAIIGSGPAGLSCAGDLRKMGYKVTVFEALQKPGGVLQYGIPEFRLPKANVVEPEINKIKNLGVEIITNYVLGKSGNVDQLLKKGYDAVFIGGGAGLPRFMKIPGENLNGVYSANEFLTRINLMKAYRNDYDTPVNISEKVVVIGGGNVAMDSARTAIRLGSEVKLVYRRSLEELPARQEEVHHAHEEGLDFQLLTNPIEIIGNDEGFVSGIKCVKMQLGKADESGRKRPEIIPESEFIIETGTVIIAIGTSPNPLLSLAAPHVNRNKYQCIEADNPEGITSQEGVFAGGDVVTGAATVIEAMGAGKRAAKAIDKYISTKKQLV